MLVFKLVWICKEFVLTTTVSKYSGAFLFNISQTGCNVCVLLLTFIAPMNVIYHRDRLCELSLVQSWPSSASARLSLSRNSMCIFLEYSKYPVKLLITVLIVVFIKLTLQEKHTYKHSKYGIHNMSWLRMNVAEDEPEKFRQILHTSIEVIFFILPIAASC